MAILTHILRQIVPVADLPHRTPLTGSLARQDFCRTYLLSAFGLAFFSGGIFRSVFVGSLSMAVPAQFKPYTDNFGSLTLHATILGDGAVMTPEDHRRHVNALVVIAAILSLIVAIVSIYTLDRMAFADQTT